MRPQVPKRRMNRRDCLPLPTHSGADPLGSRHRVITPAVPSPLIRRALAPLCVGPSFREGDDAVCCGAPGLIDWSYRTSPRHSQAADLKLVAGTVILPAWRRYKVRLRPVFPIRPRFLLSHRSAHSPNIGEPYLLAAPTGFIHDRHSLSYKAHRCWFWEMRAPDSRRLISYSRCTIAQLRN